MAKAYGVDVSPLFRGNVADKTSRLPRGVGEYIMPDEQKVDLQVIGMLGMQAFSLSIDNETRATMERIGLDESKFKLLLDGKLLVPFLSAVVIQSYKVETLIGLVRPEDYLDMQSISLYLSDGNLHFRDHTHAVAVANQINFFSNKLRDPVQNLWE